MKLDLNELLAVAALIPKLQGIFASKAGEAVVDLHDGKGDKIDHQFVFRAEVVPKGTRPAWLTSDDTPPTPAA